MILYSSISNAITTSWRGTTSTSWTVASNWTNGVPGSTEDVVIGDVNFTGSFQPQLSTKSSYCKTLTIGTAVKSCTLSLTTNSYNLIVLGDILIGSNGTISQSAKSNLSLAGNWINLGVYEATNQNATVVFSGAAQTLTGVTTFRKLNINAGSVTTLANNITARNLSVTGTFDPLTYLVSINSGSVNINGILRVKAATYDLNYSANLSLAATSTVSYAATSINQTIKNLSYGTLFIAGAMTKSFVNSGNYTVTLQSSGSGIGNIKISGGTLDIPSNCTLLRGTGVAGGVLTLANGCTIKTAGAFPANFATYTLGPTSFTEYYGGAQNIRALTYGNLTFSNLSGNVIKTMPSAAIVVAGDFTCFVTTGTLTFSALGNISVLGNVSIGAGCIFNGGIYAHEFEKNLTNAGTINGGSGTITMSGISVSISGAGVFNLFNLTITRTGTTVAATTNLTISGNLTSLGAGVLTHILGTGTITMSGSGKSIIGQNFTFNNLVISGSVSTIEDIGVFGNFTINAAGSFIASGGICSMKGTSKTIVNGGILRFFKLNIFPGSNITTSSSFSLSSNLTAEGSITATAGTVSFIGSSILTGMPNLFNVILNGTRLELGNNSVMSIAGTFTRTTGLFDVTTSTPNTVNYNSTIAQSVTSATYNKLSISNAGTKTAGGNIRVNESLTINNGATFNASTSIDSIYGDWINNGTFQCGTSIVKFLGIVDASITGVSTFNVITVEKNNTATLLTLNNNQTVATINMTSGEVRTGSNTLTITSTRTGEGVILGTITRTHTFATSIAYAFESANNTVELTTASGVTSITMIVSIGAISDFSSLASVNRQYNISVTASSYTANLRLHYNDNELNGNNESTMTMWRYNGSIWVDASKTSFNGTLNYVQLNGLNNITNRWTMANSVNVARWNGSLNTEWSNPGNWVGVLGSPNLPPSTNDIVDLGSVAYTNQPTISTSVSVRGIVFNNTTPTTLTLASGGSLVCSGNVSGKWTLPATHTVNVGSQSASIGGEFIMGDGGSNNRINTNITTGTLTVSNNLYQRSSSNLTFTGAGNLNVGGDYNYTDGIFTTSSSTVTYNGAFTQKIAPVSYYNLNINKQSGTANLISPAVVANNLTVSTGGQLDVNANLSVTGNITINSNTVVNSEGSTISVGGNWSRTGTFIQGSGTVLLNGLGAQNMDGTTFNSFTVNKPSGVASANGNFIINGALTISSGILDLLTYTSNRTALGGTMSMSAGTVLRVGGSSNFPINYGTQLISNTSTVEFNGSVAQSVPLVTFGNLSFKNGGTNKKGLSSDIIVNGDLTIHTGAQFDDNEYTVDLYGNWVNNGTFISASGTIKLSGNNKIVSGTNTFYNLSMPGSYATIAGTVTKVLGKFTNLGTFTQGSDSIYLYGDYINTGTLVLNGVTNIMGLQEQILANNGVLSSGLTGIVNYNGNVEPLIFSSGTAQYATVNINNTDGVSPLQPWSVIVSMTVGAGAKFSGNGLTHTIYGSFTNNGTVINPSGNFTFAPTSNVNINFGSSFSCEGTASFQGTGAITFSGTGSPTFGAVSITNKHLTGITPSSNWNILGNFTIRDSSLFHAGNSVVHNVSGNITTNGIFDGGTSTVILNDTLSIGGVGTTTFHNIIINSVDTALTNFNVSGNFVNNGKFDPTGYSITFSGSSQSVISGTADTTFFADLIVSKSSSSVTLSSNVKVVDDLIVNAGSTFQGGNSSITIEGNIVNDGTYNTSSAGLLIFAGDISQTISGSTPANFANVTFNNAAGIAFSSEHIVNRVLTLTKGTVSSSAGLLNLNLDYGAIAASGIGSITGNLKVTKNIATKGYHYIASPFANRTVEDWNDDVLFSPNKYYFYDETQVSSNDLVGWTSLSNTSVTLAQLRGYAVFFTEPSTSVDMMGAYTHGSAPANVNLTRTYSGPNGADGWHLVGNPFPSPINWDAATGWTRGNIYDAIYFWDPIYKRYATYIDKLGLNGGTQYIPAMQSFWVRVDTNGTNNTSYPFGMTSAVRVTSVSDTTPTHWRMEADANRLNLMISNGKINDETIIRLLDQSTEKFDGKFDAYKLMNDPTVTSFYSLFNGDKYSVNSLPPNYKKNIIPLGLKVGESGEYTITAENLDSFDPDIDIILTDTLLGTHTDLRTDLSYTFKVNKEDSNGRFFLNLVYSSLVTSANAKNESIIVISSSDNTVNVNFTNISSPTAELMITDLKGQIVTSKTIDTDHPYISQLDGISSGVYLVRVIVGDLVKIQKVVFN